MVGRLIFFAIVIALIAAFLAPFFFKKKPDDDLDDKGDGSNNVRSIKDHRQSKDD